MPSSGISRWSTPSFLAGFALWLTCPTPGLATDYFLGSLAVSQPGVAVQDIAALNQLDLEPGDRVFFQAGETFSGTIEINAEDTGTPSNPVEFSSFGNGRATISPGNNSGIVIDNAGGISVNKLDLAGAGKTPNTASGIDAGALLPDSAKLEFLRFEDMRISGFRYGVEIWAWHSTDTVAWPGFRDVALARLEVFDNLSEGIRVWGTWQPDGDGTRYAHADFRLSDCVVYNQKGDPAATAHTGSGIVLSNVDGAVIERCVAHDNGGLGPATGGGPFGIWVFEAANCTLQHNLVYNQKTSSTSDGGAFDLDGGSRNCVVQYNYSYNNDGPAVGVIQFDDAAPLVNNVVRFNISENDCRANAHGVFYVGQFSTTHGIDGADFYGNTIFVSTNARGEDPAVARVEDHTRLVNVRFRNNLFVASHAGALIGGVTNKPATALYQGNNYWGGTLNLASLRGGGQETLNGQPLGRRVDPKLQQAGGGGDVRTPSEFPGISAYRLQSDSPIASEGLDLASLFGVDPGPRDFFGQPLSSNALTIGAAALASAGEPPDSGTSPIRLVNLSVRSDAGQGDETLIVGFVIGGAGSQDVIVRGIGPGLIPLGVTDGTLADPRLTLFHSQTPLGENDNWGGSDVLAARFSALGAFGLAANSRDAALSLSLASGLYTAHLSSSAGAGGIAMVELYDDAKAGNARFVNVSARTQVGTGAKVLIAGFVLEGDGEKKLLIRGVGPSLAKLGVSSASVLSDPALTLYRGSAPIATNDNWAGAPALKTAFTATGAFGFDSDSSADAALLVTLGAGLYTAHLSGANGVTGIGLVEIYEVP